MNGNQYPLSIFCFPFLLDIWISLPYAAFNEYRKTSCQPLKISQHEAIVLYEALVVFVMLYNSSCLTATVYVGAQKTALKFVQDAVFTAMYFQNYQTIGTLWPTLVLDCSEYRLRDRKQMSEAQELPDNLILR